MTERPVQSQGAGERLQKVLARAGVASRRASEDLIAQGRVAVNGRLVRELGVRVQPGDKIAVDGRPIRVAPEHRYILLHKPSGYVSTVHDPQRRPTVIDLVPEGARLFPVGRLDADSEGLLLLTNDGELAYRMTHPSFGVSKEYRVLVTERPSAGALRLLREGVEIDGRRAAPADVTIAGQNRGGTWLRIVIHEGRKRQIRRMCESVGLTVSRLIRARMGPLRLGSLARGANRPLTDQEVSELRAELDSARRRPLVIAIDGPAGSGKSALAEQIAARHDLLFLDTGAMYRAATLLVLRQGADPSDEEAASRLAEGMDFDIVPSTSGSRYPFIVYLEGKDVTDALYTPPVGRAVSIVSAYPKVREVLVRRQREIACRGAAVVVGRDIGTVVVPDAPIKLYLHASDTVRAARRHEQLKARGIVEDFDQVLAEIRLRDRLDSERSLSPLSIASGAIVLNSDQMTLSEEVAVVDGLIEKFRVGKGLG